MRRIRHRSIDREIISDALENQGVSARRKHEVSGVRANDNHLRVVPERRYAHLVSFVANDPRFPVVCRFRAARRVEGENAHHLRHDAHRDAVGCVVCQIATKNDKLKLTRRKMRLARHGNGRRYCDPRVGHLDRQRLELGQLSIDDGKSAIVRRYRKIAGVRSVGLIGLW